MRIRVQTEDFDLSAELAELRRNQPAIGAVVSFLGTVRDMQGGSTVSAMELEHYPEMTEQALREIAQEACDRWNLCDVTVIHRVGVLHPQDQIVMVAVASSHRQDAFLGCEYIMDMLKTRAPFWKKEKLPDGWRWVEAKQTDENAQLRWEKP